MAFDPYQKEQQLRSESATWDTSAPEDAQPDDIPVIDLSEYFETDSTTVLEDAARQLRVACEETGFFSIIGHPLPRAQLSDMFTAVAAFHDLPEETKLSIRMDRPEWPVGGVGYLPLRNRKLPSRDKANLNEAFLIKRDDVLGMDDNQWLEESTLPGFRAQVEAYAVAMESLGKRLLPIFATALEMPPDFFDAAFEQPLYRLRMTHYPPLEGTPADEFGIAPHVDTTFCTILAQSAPGLTIFSERRKRWIRAPMREDAFIINSGELLRQWTNDRFISVKHFANNNIGDTPRYSIPFFFNANPHYRMHCIPSCCSPDNPAKYPPISYAESQAVAQGE